MFYCPYYNQCLFVSRQQQPYSYIRIFHASPDAPPVDVHLNNRLVARNLTYKDFTEYLRITPGTYNVRVYATGTTANPVINTNVTIPQGRIFTAAAVGKLSNIGLLPIEEPAVPKTPGRAHIRFSHLSPNASRVNVTLPDGTVLFRNVGYKETTDYIPIAPGIHTIEIRVASNNERILNVPNMRLQPNRNYTIYAVGLAGERPPLQALIPLDGNTYLKVQ